jgi:PST family polysaccharide transporter
MRFTTVAGIDILSLAESIAVGIGMALRGYGYWALVGMTLTSPAVSTVGTWISTAWIPGMPRRQAGVRSMLRFGGTITLNGIVVYFAYNLEKVLLGRFWGAQAVGIYGRGYQLVNIPTDNLNSAVGEVAFSALSRVQNEPSRFKSYFLKGYSLVLGLTLPITIVCALFAKDLIAVLLGAKWNEAAPIFRLLAPTILIFAMINPFSWLLFSIGKVGRSLKIVNGVVDRSAYCMVCKRYSNLLLGCYADPTPALTFGHRSGSIALRTAIVLWPTVISFAQAYYRR